MDFISLGITVVLLLCLYKPTRWLLAWGAREDATAKRGELGTAEATRRVEKIVGLTREEAERVSWLIGLEA